MKDGKLKSFLLFLKSPNKMFSGVIYILCLIFAITSIVFQSLNINDTALLVLYACLGITFFYSIYLLVYRDFKNIKKYFKEKKQKISSKNKFANKLFNDLYYRTMFFSSLAMIITFCFVVYNAFAGIYYSSVWNGSISVYYIFLLDIRLMTLLSEFKIHKVQPDEFQKQNQRAKVFRAEGFLLICLDIVLIAPVTLLVLSRRQIILPMWVAIANAAYTFYKVIGCIISFIKTRNSEILSVKGLKNLNLTDAAISLLSLENTMILTFSTGEDKDMFTFVIISGLVVVLLGMLLAILTLAQGVKKVRDLKLSKQNSVDIN